MTLKSISESFTAVGTSDSLMFAGSFNISVEIGTGTISLERSFDGGQKWYTVETFTSSYEDMLTDPEGAVYRWRCSAFTAGPVSGRLGQ